MKTQNLENNLSFKKASVTDLNDQQLKDINGGTGTVTSTVGPISAFTPIIIKMN